MTYAVSIIRLATGIVLLPLAANWRSPFLVEYRPAILVVLVATPLFFIVCDAHCLRLRRSGLRLAPALNCATIAVAASTLLFTLVIETRFQWLRHDVLAADSERLETLGRHIIVGYRDLDTLTTLLNRRAIAGVFITTHNVSGRSAAQIKRQVEAWQDVRRRQGLAPLWVATDQEGGGVERLSPPLTSMPPISAVVRLHADADERRAKVRDYAATHGRELAQIGVNLNFAPVVDVDYGIVNPKDRYTRIHQRAIARDPVVVADVARIYCARLYEAGVRCTLKHFPGLGRVFEDTHLEAAELSASPSELAASDWLPFRGVMQDGAFAMLAHVRLTAVDPDHPVSLSARVVGGMLRDAWNYDGVLISDDLSMRAIYASRHGTPAGAVAALNAGVDLILLSYDPDQYFPVMHALLEAEREGRLQAARLAQSEQRLARAWEADALH